MTRTEMDACLPGDPSLTLLSKVRKALKFYGLLPAGRDRWYLTWKWAERVMRSYGLSNAIVGQPRKKSWPSAREIASQYVAILLADMRDGQDLKLPHRAAEQLPPEVAVRLADTAILALGCPVPKPPALPPASRQRQLDEVFEAEVVG